MKEQTLKIGSRGHWKVTIRPGNFDQNRITDVVELLPLIRSAAVSLRGWDFPHIDPHTPPAIYEDYIGQAFEWDHHVELWKFYQSGQFYFMGGFWDDWRDQSSWWPADKEWNPGAGIDVAAIVYFFTEVYELAARLALTKAGADKMSVSITACKIKDRKLTSGDIRRAPFVRTYKSALDEYTSSQSIDRSSLTGSSWGIAAEQAQHLLRRFGWEPSIAVIKSHQEELRKNA